MFEVYGSSTNASDYANDLGFALICLRRAVMCIETGSPSLALWEAERGARWLRCTLDAEDADIGGSIIEISQLHLSEEVVA